LTVLDCDLKPIKLQSFFYTIKLQS
jgi:hypothetical protein